MGEDQLKAEYIKNQQADKPRVATTEQRISKYSDDVLRKVEYKFINIDFKTKV